MAKCSCSAKVGKFKWSKAGYKALKNSAPVQAAIKEHADATAAAANLALSPDGHIRDGYEARQVTLPRAGDKGYVVRTATDHARYSNAKHNDLLKALR